MAATKRDPKEEALDKELFALLMSVGAKVVEDPKASPTAPNKPPVKKAKPKTNSGWGPKK
jgi:hypothetical protein